MTRCLVTGASGFVGRRLVPTLVEAGHDCRTLHRGRAAHEGVAADHITADLAGGAIPQDCMSGIDLVIHLAGSAHVDVAAETHDQIHHRGTLALARAAAQAGVQHFVFLSSVKAMGEPESTGIRSERDMAAALTPYGLAKRCAEEGLEQLASTCEMKITVLRPTLIYGVGVKGNLATLMRYAATPFPNLPRVGSRSLVSLDDLIQAIIAVMDISTAGYHCYIVGGAQSYSSREVCELARAALGRSGPVLSWPLWFCRFVLTGKDLMGGVPRSSSTCDRVFGTELYSSELLEAATGWRAQYDLERALPDIVNNLNPRDESSA